MEYDYCSGLTTGSHTITDIKQRRVWSEAPSDRLKILVGCVGSVIDKDSELYIGELGSNYSRVREIQLRINILGEFKMSTLLSQLWVKW